LDKGSHGGILKLIMELFIICDSRYSIRLSKGLETFEEGAAETGAVEKIKIKKIITNARICKILITLF